MANQNQGSHTFHLRIFFLSVYKNTLFCASVLSIIKSPSGNKIMSLFQMMAYNAGSHSAPERSRNSHTAPERSDGSYYTAPERPAGSHTVPERPVGSNTVPERSEIINTAPASSDKIHEHICESCSTDGVEKAAKHFCQECSQKICDTCKDFHRKLAGTRNHVIVPVNKGLSTFSGKQWHTTDSRDNAASEISNTSNTLLLDRKVLSRSEMNVKVDGDKHSSWITGCAVTASGSVVICDRINQKIKLLNNSGVLTEYTQLSSAPRDVSVLDSTSVIATLADSKQLQVVQITPKLQPSRAITLDKVCWGVAVFRDDIYVTCYDVSGEGEVKVLDLDGNVKRRLGINRDGTYMFTEPNYVTLNKSGDKIFVSDSNTDTVTCMSVDGCVIYAYKNDSIRAPSGLLCDSEDNILVCSERSHNVQVLRADGKRHSTLLTASDGLKDPYSIAYRASDNTLLLGCLWTE